jgi:DNA-binding response OmpR family regulator
MAYVLLATDASWVADDVKAALGGARTSVGVCNDGKYVAKAIIDRTPDLVICDLQVGNMGGMATTMHLRLEESGGRLPRVPILMLLDRAADLHLARRSGADGWLIKPLDSVRIRAAAHAIMTGGTFKEGLPVEVTDVVVEDVVDVASDEVSESTEPVEAAAG